MLGIYCRTSRDTDIENSTISQQRTAGIKFAGEHKFEYELYEDEGKSGFKISDEDQDPFNNRPAFTKLINDIKDKKIDKVWVWEHSRLSRNQYASAFIFNIFEKFKITLYENEKEYDLNDPQLKFQRQILDAVSEYERQLIVARTTRGLRKRIDEGKRAHFKLYGYDKNGKDDKGHTIWVPVESELNNIRYALKRYIEGASLVKINYELFELNKLDKPTFVYYVRFLGKILRKYQYTGYQLTIEGFDIYKRFRRNEIENIQVLLDRKYWIKSVPYPVELISIEDWVKICERLQIRSRNSNELRKQRLLRASRDIATGIIECGDCGMRYYYHEQKSGKNKKGEEQIYFTYYHLSRANKTVCKQKPKSFKLDDINEIFKIFYFYFKVVFDNTNDLIIETQRTIKQTQQKIKEKIAKSEKELSVIEKRIAKFQKVIDSSQDEIDIIKYLTKQITANEDKHNGLIIEISKLKIDYEIQNERFNTTLLEMTYYDVKEKINDWFFNMNIEEQRNELIRTIKTCKMFNHHLIIDTGKIVFIFDINDHRVFDMELLENLNKDEVYKKHFIEMKGKREARKFDGKLIHNVDLNRDKEIRMRVFQYLIKTYNIIYDISEATNLISFVHLTGLMSLELENITGND
jgi:DNA invertase Pin-like site-specific DNA recombinase